MKIKLKIILIKHFYFFKSFLYKFEMKKIDES